MARLCQEGGESLASFLLEKAVPAETSQKPVREWTYNEIACLPKAEQEEWHAVCKEKLEALRRRNVYELVDPPKG